MKFLVDECLSPTLVKLAHEAGYGESSHVAWLGLLGAKDWELKPIILNGDWTFVTRNSVDFRGSLSAPGEKGQYAGVELHAGLICLNLPDSSRGSDQRQLFELALKTLGVSSILINEVLEVSLEAEEISIMRYPMPK